MCRSEVLRTRVRASVPHNRIPKPARNRLRQTRNPRRKNRGRSLARVYNQTMKNRNANRDALHPAGWSMGWVRAVDMMPGLPVRTHLSRKAFLVHRRHAGLHGALHIRSIHGSRPYDLRKRHPVDLDTERNTPRQSRNPRRRRAKVLRRSGAEGTAPHSLRQSRTWRRATRLRRNGAFGGTRVRNPGIHHQEVRRTLARSTCRHHERTLADLGRTRNQTDKFGWLLSRYHIGSSVDKQCRVWRMPSCPRLRTLVGCRVGGGAVHMLRRPRWRCVPVRKCIVAWQRRRNTAHTAGILDRNPGTGHLWCT